MIRTVLKSVIKQGSLTLIKPDGSRETFGSGSPHVAIKLHDGKALWELALNPDLKLGELYMDGRLTLEKGDVPSCWLADEESGQRQADRPAWLGRAFRRLTRRLAQFNPASRRQGACRPSLRSVGRAL